MGRGIMLKTTKNDWFTHAVYIIKKNKFIFEELVKRDFNQKYKRTALGAFWSILSPLLTLLVMKIVFTNFFGRNTPHYTVYIFAGNIIFSYFRESTKGGMQSLMSNAHIFTKINVPKYLFILSKNVSAIINFGLTLIVFFCFVAIDRIPFHPRFLMIIYPVITVTMLNIGIGMIMSALFVFFRDIQYLYDIALMLIMYMSAIFYRVDSYSQKIQRLFLLNPVYCAIKYVRVIVIDGNTPSPVYHFLLLFYGVFFLAVGSFIYKKYNHQFLYYV